MKKVWSRGLSHTRWMHGRLSGVIGIALTLAGCKEEPAQRVGAPPPEVSAKAGVCDGGGGEVRDAEAAKALPRTFEGFCIDPNDGSKSFGEGAAQPLDGICDLFDGECEIYKGFAVRKVVQARYVSGKGTSATIDVYLSKFAGDEEAYAMFTKRTVGEGDPVDEATPQPIPGGAAAAAGVGNAYLVRGPYLAELTYNDSTASVDQATKASAELLPKLVAQVGAALSGSDQPPAVVRRLPSEHRVPMGTRLVMDDLLGLEALGPGALGYYRSDEARYRIAVSQRVDQDAAKDVIKTLAKHPGAEAVDGVGDDAAALVVSEPAPAVEWVFASKGAVVIGVGDEPRVLREGMPEDERAARTLVRKEKIARLTAALAESK